MIICRIIIGRLLYQFKAFMRLCKEVTADSYNIHKITL